MNTLHLPTAYLKRMEEQLPGCWRKVDEMRAQRGLALPDWPTWCFLPLAGSYAIVSGGGSTRLPVEALPRVGALGALAAWRVTQGIYEFHPSVREAIETTPVEGDLPSDLFTLLPEWCVYVRRASSDGAQGFFAFLEYDANDHHAELRLVLDRPPQLQSLMPLHLGRGSLEDCITAATKAAQSHARRLGLSGLPPTDVERLATVVSPLVALTLYLCARNAEVRDRAVARAHPERPLPTTTKHGPRLFPPPAPTIWEAGWRTGAALEGAARGASQPQGGTHARPRPHIRRAHWHHYWTGPQTETRCLALRWLHPITVNLEAPEDLVPTTRSVR